MGDQGKSCIIKNKSLSLQMPVSISQGGHSTGKNTGGWLDSLGCRILMWKIYVGVFKKIDLDDR